jgi:hypothetical protein
MVSSQARSMASRFSRHMPDRQRRWRVSASFASTARRRSAGSRCQPDQQVQPQVEEVPGLSALHERGQLLSDQLHLRHGGHRERRDTELGHVEQRIADREDEVLADAHLELGGARIGERVEAELDDQPARRRMAIASLAARAA